VRDPLIGFVEQKHDLMRLQSGDPEQVAVRED
jgi:hypothetical protein